MNVSSSKYACISNSMVLETESSPSLVINPVIRHDSEPFVSTFHSHKLFPAHIYILHTFPFRSTKSTFSKMFYYQNCVHFLCQIRCRTTGVRFKAGARNISLFRNFHTGSPILPGSFSEDKRAGAWSWPLTSSKFRELHSPVCLYGILLNYAIKYSKPSLIRINWEWGHPD
jgi:hypothetical protein